MLGEIIKGSAVSAYQPKQVIADFTGKVVKKDYNIGLGILTRPWPELNNYSVIERTNKDQRTFQAFVDESVDDPETAWEWRGTRALAQKKAFAMHAHLTANYIIPGVFAQNPAQDEDRIMAGVMRDIEEWAIINSEYRSQFMLVAMGMLVNPVTYFQIDYNEVYQKIKEKTDKGLKVSEILDEVYSGLDCRILSVNQVLITNAHEQNIQKQRAIIKKRFVDYSELKAKYGEHPNWEYLQPGVKSVYNDADGLFYDIKDDANPTLIEEAIWENRREDGEVPFLNGIYFGDDNLENNPIKHRDNRNAPKYNTIPFGYHRRNEHFFYYGSLMFEVGWDDQLIDAMYGMTMNREFIDLKQPTAYIGFPDKIDTSVIFPGASISTSNPQAKIQPLITPRAGNSYRALQEIEDSMSESSLPESEMGVLPEASQKATAIVKASQSAKILLTGAAKNLGESVTQVGGLLLDVILQHLTIPEIDEITGNLKYKEFVLENKMVGGRKISKKIRFDETLMNKMTEKQKKQRSMKIMEEIGWPKNKQSLAVINPYLFSKMKFLTRIEPEEMLSKNKDFDRVMMERLYALLKDNPNVDAIALLRVLLYAETPEYADILIKEQQENSTIQQIMGNVQNKQTKQLPGLPANVMAGA